MNVEDRVFVYFRHRKRSTTLLASHDLSTLGVPKKPITYGDKRCDAIGAVLNYMARCGKGNPRIDKRLLADAARAHLVGKFDIVDIVHLPATPHGFGERIMVKFKEE